MAGRRVREEQVEATREAILAAAERLFAEHGVYNVSNRQISEAAGQGNTAAVNYHFGNKTDLVRAIARRHTDRIEQIRHRLVTRTEGSTDLREWVACMVRPITEHLQTLGSPTWYARFTAQVSADPALYAAIATEPANSPSVRALVRGLDLCLPGLPPSVRTERGIMARHLVVQMCVEHERALAEGRPAAPTVWADAATALVDALTGLWSAPVSSPVSAPVSSAVRGAARGAAQAEAGAKSVPSNGG